MSMWYLEGDFNQDGRHTQQHLHSLPATLGRDENLELAIPYPAVSRIHARIADGGSGILTICDLESSNGTFVNRHKIVEPTVIGHGDIIHLGTMEIRLIDRSHFLPTADQAVTANHNATAVISISEVNLSETIPAGVPELEELIDKKQINMVFQPVVVEKDNTICGYEILGRGTHPKLVQNPLTLFRIAESVGLQVKLSTLMRDIGIETASKHNVKGMLLVNTHPKEMEDCDLLLSSLTDLRKHHPDALIMLEINEQAVTDLSQLKALKHALSKLSIKLAFDDFGVGQSRIMELVDAQPHIVKFDRAFIQEINLADSAKLSVLMHMHQMVTELRITTLAECVSSQEEYQACQAIGFDLYQGYLFGKPAPVSDIKAKL